MPGLTAELVRIAAHLDTHAVTLRSRARRLGSATSATRWQSGAATLAQHRFHQTLALIGLAAAGLERAADELRSHARRVRREDEVLADISRAGRALESFAGRAVGRLR